MTAGRDTSWMDRLAGGEARAKADARQVLDLHQRETLWLVVEGLVNVFSSPGVDGRPGGERRFVTTVRAGGVLFGSRPPAHARSRRLFAVGDPDTVVVRLGKARLLAWLGEESDPSRAGEILETWAASLARAIAAAAPPSRTLDIPVNTEFTADRGACLRPRRGLLWFRHLTGGSCYEGVPNLYVSPADPFIPLARDTWLEVREDRSTLLAIPTQQYLDHPESLWQSLDVLAGMVLECLSLQALEQREIEIAAALARREHETRLVTSALREVAEVAAPGRTPAPLAADPDLVAVRALSLAAGLELPAGLRGVGPGIDRVARIAGEARIRTRRVRLEHGWWRHDHGPLLGWYGAAATPAALVPGGPGRYVLVDPGSGERRPVDADLAAALRPQALVLHRTFPDRALGIVDLAAFALRGSWRGLAAAGALGLGSALLALATPLAAGWVVATAIPTGTGDGLPYVAAGLLAAALASFAYQLVGAFVLLRLETRAEGEVLAAVWDRLLALPVAFFRRYTVGDLAARAAGLGEVRRLASGHGATLLVATLTFACSLALCLALSPRLAPVAVLLALVFAAVTAVACWAGAGIQRRIMDLGGRVSGFVLQLIFGLAKVRVAGAQTRAFAAFARMLAAQQRFVARLGLLEAGLGVFRPVFFSACAAVLFWATWASAGSSGRIAPAEFVAFCAAFGQALASLAQLGTVAVSLLRVGSLFDRASCILTELPEAVEGKLDPGELCGGLEVTAVTFRYRDEGPETLAGVSLSARPGDFVALVGPSGSGKSTLLRILLGFERPRAGCVRYDGRDLADLDLTALRRQIGVVLQHGRVMSGDIHSNIAGGTELTMDEAWEAARMADLEADIARLPMGMRTIITEGGSTFSGGQRQRLLIARAIAHKPRLLFLDEATSSLDNRTQAQVLRSLDRLDVTRIVVAHRLSTIRHADRIHVLSEGRIVESGTFEELMRGAGLFSRLARRQVVDAPSYPAGA